MLTLTQTRLKSLFASFVAITALSILGSLVVPQDSAYAADYPGEWCSFKESADNKSLTGSCTDNDDNGGFHDVVFKESGKNTYAFTDSFWTTSGVRIPVTSHDKPDGVSSTGQEPKETKCKPATINYSGDSATISGQYASTTASSGGLRMWTCVDLLAGKVTVDKGLVRLTAWRDALYKSLLESLPKTECKRFNEGSNNYKQCVSGVGVSVNLCVGSNGSVWKETQSFQDPNEQKDAYKATTIDCLDNKLSVTTRAEIRSAVNNAQSAADDKEGEIVDTEGEGGEETLAETTSCAIDGIGWIVCPVMTFIGRMNDAAFGFLERMLGIQPAVVMSDPVRNAWAAFRDISNVAFVIAFMLIVYSQLTSAGISNYGIKKMLPRIVAAAILVNISFYICAVAVDISNIIGSSVYSLLKDSIDIGSEIQTTQWESSVSSILGIAATGLGIILLLVAITMAPAVLLAFMLIILILIARQALVILLIVIAPLAFVAYLLPNTESWFKKWQKAFITVLMVYPIVGLIFGASTLAASVLVQVAQGGEEDQQLLMLVALGVLAVPLFAVPAVLKGSLSAAGSVGTKLAGLADRSTRVSGKQFSNRAGSIRKDVGNRFKIAAQDPENKWGRRLGGYSRFSNRREVGKRDRETAANRAAELGYATSMIETDAEGKFTNRAVRMQKAAAGGVGVYNEKGQVRAEALATQRTFKQFDDDISAFKTTQTNDTHETLLSKATNTSLSVEERSAAAGTIAGRSFRQGHNEMLDKVYEQMNTADTELRAAEASGDTASIAKAQEAVGTVSAIQKQLIGDLKDKPFGLGDRAMGQLGEGKYGRAMETTDEATGQTVMAPLVSPREELRQRVGKKLNAQTVASLNPDDLALIHEDAKSGALKPDQMKNLITQIAAARANKDTAALIKPEADTKFNDIIAAATAMGITVDPSNAQGGTTPGIVLPGDTGFSRTGGGPTAP